MSIRTLVSRCWREARFGVWTVGATAALIGSWAPNVVGMEEIPAVTSAKPAGSAPVVPTSWDTNTLRAGNAPIGITPNRLRGEGSEPVLRTAPNVTVSEPPSTPAPVVNAATNTSSEGATIPRQFRRAWAMLGIRSAEPESTQRAQTALATVDSHKDANGDAIQRISYPAESPSAPVDASASPDDASTPLITVVESDAPAIPPSSDAGVAELNSAARNTTAGDDDPLAAVVTIKPASKITTAASREPWRPAFASPPAPRLPHTPAFSQESTRPTYAAPAPRATGAPVASGERPHAVDPILGPAPPPNTPQKFVAFQQPEALPERVGGGNAPVRDEPFSVIEQTGEIKVTVRRSKLLQIKFDILRTAIVDPSVCDIVQFSPRELSIIGRGVGSTHVTFWFDGQQQRPHTYLVTVEPDGSVRKQVEVEYQMLEDLIAELFPDSKVRLNVMADKLIVRGQAKDSAEAAQVMAMVRSQAGYGGLAGNGAGISIGGGQAARVLSDLESGQTGSQRPSIQVINMLRVPGVQQVALRVKIAELNRSAARGFGVDISGNINLTKNNNGAKLFLNSMLNAAGGGLPILGQFDGDDILVGMRYLESHGIVRLISEPTLVTMSGLPATFVAGGEFAVPTIVGSAGLNAVTTDFRSFGAIISFLPTVIDKDHIRLRIAPEFSQVNRDLAVGGTPGLTSRSLNTTIEMREGQTFAVAGLLEDNLRTSTSGNLPFLAKLLGKRDAAHNETELLILVTPELVHPMEAEEVPPLPGFDVTEPDNFQFFLRGDIEGNPTRDYRSTVWPRLRQRYNSGGTSMISGPFGHAQ